MVSNIITKIEWEKLLGFMIKVSAATKKQMVVEFVRMNSNDFYHKWWYLAGTAAVFKTGGQFFNICSSSWIVTLFNTSNDYGIKQNKKTLTIVLDFDENEQLENFSYMYSSF